MAKYTVRVELHNVAHSSKTYEQLHDLMAQGGFFRTFKGGTAFLPPAEYRGEIDLAIQTVANAAKGFAEKANPGGGVSVIVTREEDFADAGTFNPASPVFHGQMSGVPGRTACNIAALQEDIRANKTEAGYEMNRRGGRLCTLCYP